MSTQLVEQRKALAKLSKLSVSAFTSIENLETKLKNREVIGDTVTKSQPMERIKKVSEDTAKLSNYVRDLDMHLESIDKKMKDEVQRSGPLNKTVSRLGKYVIGNFIYRVLLNSSDSEISFFTVVESISKKYFGSKYSLDISLVMYAINSLILNKN